MEAPRPALQPITPEEIADRMADQLKKSGYRLSPEMIRNELNNPHGNTLFKKSLQLIYTVVVFQLIIIEQQLAHAAKNILKKTATKRPAKRSSEAPSPRPEPRPQTEEEREREKKAEEVQEKVNNVRLRLEHALKNFAKLSVAIALLAEERRNFVFDEIFPHLDSSHQLNPDEVYLRFKKLTDFNEIRLTIMSFGGNLAAGMLEGIAANYSDFQLKFSKQTGMLNEQLSEAAATLREVREEFKDTLSMYQDLGGDFTPSAPLPHPKPSAPAADLPPSYEEVIRFDHVTLPPTYEEVILHDYRDEHIASPRGPSAPTPKPPGSVDS